MKSIGIIKYIDKLGRFKIPKSLLDSLMISNGDSLIIYKSNESIAIDKYKDTCIFCDTYKNIQEFKNKKICSSCLERIKGTPN